MYFVYSLLSGFYIYIDSASPRQAGDSATLNSPMLVGVKCLSFWYYMGGADQGYIHIMTDHDLWTMSGPLDNTWQHATVTARIDDETYTYTVSMKYR